jgi:hypothetical protein
MAQKAAEILSGLQAKDGTSARDIGNIAAVVLLEENPILQKLVAVWPNVPLPPLPLNELMPASLPEGQATRWLWSLVPGDVLARWIETAGLPDATHTRRFLQVAIDNRMVFPDGTVSKWASQFIRTLVGGTLARRGVKTKDTVTGPPPTAGGPTVTAARTP